MTMTESKKRDYQNPELVERSENLQKEALDDKTGGVFVVHKIQLEFIEKLDLKTAKDAWTDEEKEQISKLTDPMSDRVSEFVAKELENNDKLGLLEIRCGAGDYKAIAKFMSGASGLRDLLSLVK